MPIIRRSRCFAALVTVFIAGLAPYGATNISTLQAATRGQGQSATPSQGPRLTILGSVGGYTFLNVDGPNSGTNAAAGTNLNALSNRGVGVGFDIDNNADSTTSVAMFSEPLRLSTSTGVPRRWRLESIALAT
jgi:hypothetical protein